MEILPSVGQWAEDDRRAEGSSAWVAPRARVDNTLVKALARAFRWRTLLETGVYGTVSELAAAEKINPSYVVGLPPLTAASDDDLIAATAPVFEHYLTGLLGIDAGQTKVRSEA